MFFCFCFYLSILSFAFSLFLSLFDCFTFFDTDSQNSQQIFCFFLIHFTISLLYWCRLFILFCIFFLCVYSLYWGHFTTNNCQNNLYKMDILSHHFLIDFVCLPSINVPCKRQQLANLCIFIWKTLKNNYNFCSTVWPLKFWNECHTECSWFCLKFLIQMCLLLLCYPYTQQTINRNVQKKAYST